jgi:hypothetical protein
MPEKIYFLLPGYFRNITGLSFNQRKAPATYQPSIAAD